MVKISKEAALEYHEAGSQVKLKSSQPRLIEHKPTCR